MGVEQRVLEQALRVLVQQGRGIACRPRAAGRSDRALPAQRTATGSASPAAPAPTRATRQSDRRARCPSVRNVAASIASGACLRGSVIDMVRECSRDVPRRRRPSHVWTPAAPCRSPRLQGTGDHEIRRWLSTPDLLTSCDHFRTWRYYCGHRARPQGGCCGPSACHNCPCSGPSGSPATSRRSAKAARSRDRRSGRRRAVRVEVPRRGPGRAGADRRTGVRRDRPRAGLPVPEIVFADLDPDLARTEPDPEIHALIRDSAGLNLALDYLPGSVTFDPGRRDSRAGSRLADRLVRRLRHQRRSHRAQHQHADVASAPLADRPWRDAVLSPRAGLGGRRRSRARSVSR